MDPPRRGTSAGGPPTARLTVTDTTTAVQPRGLVRPRLRGVTHLYAFFVSLVSGTVLVVVAPSGRATVAAAVYAAGMSGMLGASALLHRGNWSETTYRQLTRLDHSMIFIMIAGTYTPLALLALSGWIHTAILVAVWAGAAFGIVFEWASARLPHGWVTSIYITIGWLGVISLPWLWDSLGVLGFLLIFGGGLFYTGGAIVHAARAPDPSPLVFGYHEIFHVCVLVAAAMHYGCIAFIVLPRG
jgi:hemolysin III